MVLGNEPVAAVVDIWSYILSIDWQEPWLWFLIAFHILCALTTTMTVLFSWHNVQIALFFIFLAMVYCSEYLNEWASQNYRRFSIQQYFDDKGMFVSLLFSTPLLINCFILVLHWMLSSMQTLVQLKKAKLRVERRAQQQEKDK